MNLTLVRQPICLLIEKHPNPEQQQILKLNPEFFSGDFVNCCLAQPDHRLNRGTSTLSAQEFYTNYSDEISSRLEPAWAQFLQQGLTPVAIETDLGFLVVDESRIAQTSDAVKAALTELSQSQPDIRQISPTFCVRIHNQIHPADGILEISGYLLYSLDLRGETENAPTLGNVRARWLIKENAVMLDWS